MTDKNKKLKIALISLFVIVLCVISYFASSEDYNSNNEITEDDTSILETATKEAGEVKDSEKAEFNTISVDDYLNLYKGENKVILISRPTCQYCKLAQPILENIVYNYNVEINYIDIAEISDEDKSNLANSNSYFSKGISTPLLLVVGNSSIVDKIEGLVTSESYQKFFKEYGFME